MNEDMKELLGESRDMNESPVGHRARMKESVDRNPDFVGFSDYQLLEFLLFTTIPRKDTKKLAKELIYTFGSLSAVLHADYYELIRVDGVGETTAQLLAHVLPIVVRAEYSRYADMKRLATAQEAAGYLHARFLGSAREKLLLVSLNINDRVIQVDEIADGAVDSASVDIMKILRIADRNGAKQLILAHNHPGGTMVFSDADIEMTGRVVASCALTGFSFSDHLIFHGARFLSMFGNDAMTQALDKCTEITRNMSDVSTQEKTHRSMLFRLNERNIKNNNEYKMRILEAYKEIYNIDKDGFNELMLAAMKPVGKR